MERPTNDVRANRVLTYNVLAVSGHSSPAFPVFLVDVS